MKMMKMKKLKQMNDNPFECENREEDKCKVEDGSCPDEEYKGTCCLFCPKKWTCWSACPKVQSYTDIQKDNPSSRWSERENEEVEDLAIKAECRIMGNPSLRNNPIEKNDKEGEEGEEL